MYSYISSTRRLQPYDDSALNGAGTSINVEYSCKIGDARTLSKSISSPISQLEVALPIPEGYALIPSSITADTAFGLLVAKDNQLVLQSAAASSTAAPLAFIDEAAKGIKVDTWAVNATNKFELTSATMRDTTLPVDELSFRLPITPVKPDSVQILVTLDAGSGGNALNLQFNSQGVLDSDFAQGRINYQTGLVTLRFVKRIDLTGTYKTSLLTTGSSSTSNGQNGTSTGYNYNRTYEYWGLEHAGDFYKGTATEVFNNRIYGFEPLLAQASTIRYNAIGYTFVPLNKDILGVDTVKLPPSGKVPAYRVGDLILVKSNKVFELTDLTPEQAISVGQTRLSLAEIVDALGEKLPFETYNVDLDAGEITLKPSFPSTLYQQPFKVQYQYQDMAVAGSVSISGEIKLTKPLTHVYDPQDTLVSSALLIGTLQARVFNVFTQNTWEGNFLPYRVGSDSIFKYDTSVATIVVTNESCIKDEWALVFRTTTQFDLIGKAMGKIASGTTTEDFTPLNPVTKKPLFHFPKEGFSSGANAGNTLRFDTNGANYPLWLVRTVLQSEPTSLSHSFSLEFKGNVDREV